MRFICYFQESLLSGSRTPPAHFCEPELGVSICAVLSWGLDGGAESGVESGATIDADMLDPVGFLGKTGTTRGVPVYQIRASHGQLVLHRAKTVRQRQRASG